MPQLCHTANLALDLSAFEATSRHLRLIRYVPFHDVLRDKDLWSLGPCPILIHILHTVSLNISLLCRKCGSLFLLLLVYDRGTRAEEAAAALLVLMKLPADDEARSSWISFSRASIYSSNVLWPCFTATSMMATASFNDCPRLQVAGNRSPMRSTSQIETHPWHGKEDRDRSVRKVSSQALNVSLLVEDNGRPVSSETAALRATTPRGPPMQAVPHGACQPS